MHHASTSLAFLVIAAALAGCSSPAASSTRGTAHPITSAARTDAPADRTVRLPPDIALAADVAAAANTLANADAYGGEAVGYAGDPVAAVAALRAIMASPEAPRALELVVQHGTLAGQLLALTGLYRADHALYLAHVGRFRGQTATVKMHRGGCGDALYDVTVAELVEAPGSMQLAHPGETLQDWARRNGTGPIVLDIAGGGYPLTIAGG